MPLGIVTGLREGEMPGKAPLSLGTYQASLIRSTTTLPSS